jgi:hypothetical protein
MSRAVFLQKAWGAFSITFVCVFPSWKEIRESRRVRRFEHVPDFSAEVIAALQVSLLR